MVCSYLFQILISVSLESYLCYLCDATVALVVLITILQHIVYQIIVLDTLNNTAVCQLFLNKVKIKQTLKKD